MEGHASFMRSSLRHVAQRLLLLFLRFLRSYLPASHGLLARHKNEYLYLDGRTYIFAQPLKSLKVLPNSTKCTRFRLLEK